MTSPFGFRRVSRELEARLTPAGPGSGRGKAERKSYADGEERLKVKVRDLALPDGTSLDLQVADRRIGSLTLADGRGNADLTSDDGWSPAPLDEGDVLEVIADGETILKGVLNPD